MNGIWRGIREPPESEEERRRSSSCVTVGGRFVHAQVQRGHHMYMYYGVRSRYS